MRIKGIIIRSENNKGGKKQKGQGERKKEGKLIRNKVRKNK